MIDATTASGCRSGLSSIRTRPRRSTALLIHPVTQFESGHRYIVAMRKLRDASDAKLPAPEGFRYYRDDLPSDEAAINDQRKRFDKVFRALRKVKVKRKSLYLAWDFTVASDDNIAKRLLHIRDDAFNQLGDTNLADGVVSGTAPQFAVDTVTDRHGPGDRAPRHRHVRGPVLPDQQLPAAGGLRPGRQRQPGAARHVHGQFRLHHPPRRRRRPGGRARPTVAVRARPAGFRRRGRLEPAADARPGAQLRLLRHGRDRVLGGGRAEHDRDPAEPAEFPQLTDRSQQGLLNELLLGRLMDNPDGFLSDAAFHADGTDVNSPPVIDTSKLYYNGNSQGGILGGALTAVSPDFTRASLGVPAMGYSTLLTRSIDFDTYASILYPAYPNELSRPLALSLIQMLWDRAEPNGYAHRMTTNPLPNTPPHEVLMNVALGDHQVTNYQADVEARTVGAQIHSPVVYDGRWPDFDVAWNIPRIASYPYKGSAIVYWDGGPVRPDPMNPGEVLGTNVPPLGNVPNTSGEDPHGLPRAASEEQQMVSDFLRPDAQSQITDTCNGHACYDGGFTGP